MIYEDIKTERSYGNSGSEGVKEIKEERTEEREVGMNFSSDFMRFSWVWSLCSDFLSYAQPTEIYSECTYTNRGNTES